LLYTQENITEFLMMLPDLCRTRLHHRLRETR